MKYNVYYHCDMSSSRFLVSHKSLSTVLQMMSSMAHAPTDAGPEHSVDSTKATMKSRSCVASWVGIPSAWVSVMRDPSLSLFPAFFPHAERTGKLRGVGPGGLPVPAPDTWGSPAEVRQLESTLLHTSSSAAEFSPPYTYIASLSMQPSLSCLRH